MPIQIEIIGLEELRSRLAQFPHEYATVERKTLGASLLTLHENVPPYPPKPATSGYKRTGTLGRTLGSGEAGGALGQADIMEIKLGTPVSEASFGTRLNYAPKVIGEVQEQPFASYWWNIKTIAERAADKIVNLWKIMAQELANFLERKG